MGGFSLFRIHLEELIRARTPLFYIGSIEIKRCVEELRSVAARLNAEIQVFSLSKGIVEGDGEKTDTDPIGILDTIMKRSSNPVSKSGNMQPGVEGKNTNIVGETVLRPGTLGMKRSRSSFLGGRFGKVTMMDMYSRPQWGNLRPMN